VSTKCCSKCKAHKLLTEFYADKTNPDKLDYVCKQCRIAYQNANKDKLRARQRRYEERLKNKRAWKEISPDDAKRTITAARNIAFKWGHPNLADDLAQEVLIQNSRNKVKRKLEHIFIDMLRQMYGRTNGDRSAVASAERDLIEINPAIATGDNIDNQSKIDTIADIDNFVFKKFNPKHDLQKRIIYFLRIKLGVDAVEIARVLGVTEPRISQILSEITTEIGGYLNYERRRHKTS
jgi:DNA-directed RNA polymerase specialized sigma subunit